MFKEMLQLPSQTTQQPLTTSSESSGKESWDKSSWIERELSKRSSPRRINSASYVADLQNVHNNLLPMLLISPGEADVSVNRIFISIKTVIANFIMYRSVCRI